LDKKSQIFGEKPILEDYLFLIGVKLVFPQKAGYPAFALQKAHLCLPIGKGAFYAGVHKEIS
jgi:hypothetical protein